MDYVKLGGSNVKVSRLCLGTMMFGGKTEAEEATRIVRAAAELGVNFIDTADVYASGRCETILGDAMQGLRDRFVLASKAGMRMGEGPNDEGVSRYHLVRAVEASLKRLRTDRLDVLYLHWPNESMELEDTLGALDDLVKQGKVLYAACSNFPAWLWCRSLWIAELRRWVPLIAGQYPYNLIERGLELEILPMAKSLRLGITVYRPLGAGTLTGKYLRATPQDSRGEKDERIGRWMTAYRSGIEGLAAFAQARGFTAADAANAWIASHPAVTSVIVGVSRLDQLHANVRGFDLRLTPEDREQLSGLFATEVREEAGGKFPAWRRSLSILT